MKCPNCGADAHELKNGGFLCPACDVVFRVERDAKKVQAVDVIKDLSDRVTRLEKNYKSDPKPEQEPETETEDLDDDLI